MKVLWAWLRAQVQRHLSKQEKRGVQPHRAPCKVSAQPPNVLCTSGQTPDLGPQAHSGHFIACPTGLPFPSQLPGTELWSAHLPHSTPPFLPYITHPLITSHSTPAQSLPHPPSSLCCIPPQRCTPGIISHLIHCILPSPPLQRDAKMLGMHAGIAEIAVLPLPPGSGCLM